MNKTSHPLRCSCGAVRGEVAMPGTVNRGLCYCKDCQAFAHYLGRAQEVLDGQGGTDVLQMAPRRITFTAGREKLACVRLTNRGMLRWYAACCNSPIGNTLASPGFSFVGVVHTCLRGGARPLDEVFGPLSMSANGRSARGQPKPKDRRILPGVLKLIAMMTRERVSGRYRQNPFFSADTLKPVMTPRVLSADELKVVRDQVEAAGR